VIRDLIWSAWRTERNRRVTAERRLEQALTEIECFLDTRSNHLAEKADLIAENTELRRQIRVLMDFCPADARELDT
jgi:hypothetical protein